MSDNNKDVELLKVTLSNGSISIIFNHKVNIALLSHAVVASYVNLVEMIRSTGKQDKSIVEIPSFIIDKLR